MEILTHEATLVEGKLEVHKCISNGTGKITCNACGSIVTKRFKDTEVEYL